MGDCSTSEDCVWDEWGDWSACTGCEGARTCALYRRFGSRAAACAGALCDFAFPGPGRRHLSLKFTLIINKAISGSCKFVLVNTAAERGYLNKDKKVTNNGQTAKCLKCCKI